MFVQMMKKECVVFVSDEYRTVRMKKRLINKCPMLRFFRLNGNSRKAEIFLKMDSASASTTLDISVL